MLDTIQLLYRLGVLIGLLITGQATIQQVLTEIYGGVQNTAREHQQYAVETIAANGTNTVNHPTWGNHALYTLLQNIGTALVAMEGNITGAISALPAGSDLVIPTAGAIGDEVWGRQDPNSTPSMAYGDEQYKPWVAALNANVYGLVPYHLAPFFAYNWNDNFSGIQSINGTWPTPDWTAILPSDTRLSWLQRTDTGGLTWEDVGDGTPHGYRNSGPFPVADWYLMLTEAQFDALKGAQAVAAPIWPGAANVTLGTPVNLTASGVVTAVMDGILLTVNAVRPGTGDWLIGGVVDYKFGGYVVFISAEGHADPTQWIGPSDTVFVPKAMHQAGSVLVIFQRATDVTVTPWVAN